MNKASDLSYVKKTNALFLGFILLFMAMELVIGVLAVMDVNIAIVPTLFISQSIILVPSLVFVVIECIELKEWVPFKKIKWSTFWLTILFTMCLSPFISFINVLSQLFTTNIVAELSGEFLSVSPLVLMFVIGFFGPFCEEFTFRGIIYHGLSKSGRTLAAILVSALFFGLMHMNLNQFSYAFILGLAFGLINEATGSIFPSLIMHILINSVNVGMQYIADYGMTLSGESPKGLAGALSELDAGTDDILMIAGVLLIPALIGLALSIVVFIAICRKEGSLDRIRSLFKQKKPSPSEEGSASPHVSEQETSSGAVAEAVSRDNTVTASGAGSESESESTAGSEAVTETEAEAEAGPETGAASISAPEAGVASISEPEAPASVKKAKCPVITASGWIAIAICVLVIAASDILSQFVEGI